MKTMRPLFVLIAMLFIFTATNAQNTLTDIFNSRILKSAANNINTEFVTQEQLSGAVYSGVAAKQTSYFDAPLAIMNTSEVGFVTLQSKGKVTKITINWNKNIKQGAKLVVYGKTTPYVAFTDLYNEAERGNIIKEFIFDSTENFHEFSLSEEIRYLGFINDGSETSFINSIEIEWESSNDVFQFSADDVSTKLGDASIAVPTLTNTYSNKELVYTSSYCQVATVDETDGTVTPVAEGTTRITATLKGTDISASYVLTVLPSVGYTYYRVTSADELVDGCHYLFVAFRGEHTKFMCNEGTQSENSAIAVRKAYDFSDISISTDSSSITNVRIMTSASEEEKAAEFMLEKVVNNSKTYCAFRDNVCEGWLGKKPKSSGIYLLTSESRLVGCLADISFNENGSAYCLFGTDTPLYVRYNPVSQYFACYINSTSQTDIFLYRRFDPSMMGRFALNSEGFCTYYSEHAFVMPEGVTGGIVTAADGNRLTIDYCYEAGSVVPARTGLLLKGKADKEHICFFTESEETAPINNMLHGGDAVDKDGYTSVGGSGTRYYILSCNANGKNLGFYWATADGGAIAYQPGHAFLAIEGIINSASFFIDDNTTAIDKAVFGNSAVDTIPNNRIYTLTGHYAGQDINALSPGVYIVGGKGFVK